MAIQSPASNSLLNKMTSRVHEAFEKSITPQKYQGLANILHYSAGVPLSPDLLDDPTYYGKPGNYGSRYWTPEVPDKFKAVNNPDNIEKLIQWAQNQAMQRSLNRVIEKFKINDPMLLQRVQNNLYAIYNQYDKPTKINTAVADLKNLLITERIKSHASQDYQNNKAQFDKIIDDFTKGKIDAQQAKATISQLSPTLANTNNSLKLESILSKFAILRKIESPDQVSSKIEDEIYGEIQQKFAQEIEGMNNVERIQFDATEVLYRGIAAQYINREQILKDFNNIHRAISAMGDIGTHQIKTPWNEIAHPEGLNIASNATATSLDPSIALDYSTWKGGQTEGWVYEIRPKTGETGVALVNYEGRGERYSEIDMTQIDPKDIIAIHHIEWNYDNGVATIGESIQNPNYKKREADNKIQGVLSDGATIIKNGSTPRGIEITTKQGTKSTFDVQQSDAYRKHIKDKQIKQGNLPTPEEIRTRRAAIPAMPKLQERVNKIDSITPMVPEKPTIDPSIQFKQDIQNAKSIEELISMIEKDQLQITDSNGMPVNNEIMLFNLKQMSTNLDLLAKVANETASFFGTEITRANGFRDKVVQLLKQKYEQTIKPKVETSPNSPLPQNPLSNLKAEENLPTSSIENKPQDAKEKTDKDTALTMILNKTADTLNQDYKQLYQNKHAKDRRILGLYQLAKGVAKQIIGITKEREQQINDISRVFSFLEDQNKNLLPSTEKAKIAYAHLEKVKESLGNSSSLKTLCKNLQTEIEKAVPGTKAFLNESVHKKIYSSKAEGALLTIKNPYTPNQKKGNRLT